jgi:hypothetical protein
MDQRYSRDSSMTDFHVWIGTSGQSHWQENKGVPAKTLPFLFSIDPCGEAAGNWLIGLCSEQEQERGRRCGGGAKRPWLLLGYSISRARLWTAVPLSVLWNRRSQLRRGRAGQGRPGHACGRSGKEPFECHFDPCHAPVLHVDRTWRGSRPLFRKSAGSHGLMFFAGAQN